MLSYGIQECNPHNVLLAYHSPHIWSPLPAALTMSCLPTIPLTYDLLCQQPSQCPACLPFPSHMISSASSPHNVLLAYHSPHIWSPLPAALTMSCLPTIPLTYDLLCQQPSQCPVCLTFPSHMISSASSPHNVLSAYHSPHIWYPLPAALTMSCLSTIPLTYDLLCQLPSQCPACLPFPSHMIYSASSPHNVLSAYHSSHIWSPLPAALTMSCLPTIPLTYDLLCQQPSQCPVCLPFPSHIWSPLPAVLTMSCLPTIPLTYDLLCQQPSQCPVCLPFPSHMISSASSPHNVLSAYHSSHIWSPLPAALTMSCLPTIPLTYDLLCQQPSQCPVCLPFPPHIWSPLPAVLTMSCLPTIPPSHMISSASSPHNVLPAYHSPHIWSPLPAALTMSCLPTIPLTYDILCQQPSQCPVCLPFLSHMISSASSPHNVLSAYHSLIYDLLFQQPSQCPVCLPFPSHIISSASSPHNVLLAYHSPHIWSPLPAALTCPVCLPFPSHMISSASSPHTASSPHNVLSAYHSSHIWSPLPAALTMSCLPTIPLIYDLLFQQPSQCPVCLPFPSHIISSASSPHNVLSAYHSPHIWSPLPAALTMSCLPTIPLTYNILCQQPSQCPVCLTFPSHMISSASSPHNVLSAYHSPHIWSLPPAPMNSLQPSIPGRVPSWVLPSCVSCCTEWCGSQRAPITLLMWSPRWDALWTRPHASASTNRRA